MLKDVSHLFEDDVIDACIDDFEIGITLGHRLGQAYFNALGETERNLLRGTKYDPFYFDSVSRVLAAHKFLKKQLNVGAYR